MSEFSLQEPELPINALRGLGEQALELVAPFEGSPLGQASEELTFRSPFGVDKIEPYTLHSFVELFMPDLDEASLLQGWRESEGRVDSVHLRWQVDPMYSGGTIVSAQLRNRSLAQRITAVELRTHVTGVVDREPYHAEVSVGGVDERGEFLQDNCMSFTDDYLSGALSKSESRTLIDLANSFRHILTCAEIHPYVQSERSPLPPAL